jgi:hypothetical protein
MWLEFDISVDINDSKNAKRTVETVQSSISFYRLRDQVALILKAHPQSVQLQYRFSNDRPSALPCDLTSERELRAMVDRLRPLVVPPMLSNGKRSTRVMKAVTVQLFNKDDGDPSLTKGDGKVSLKLLASHQPATTQLLSRKQLRPISRRSKSLYHLRPVNILQAESLSVPKSQRILHATSIAFRINPRYAGKHQEMMFAIQLPRTI